MYYKRITPDGNLDWLKEIDRRIANLETPPSGSIYIRDGTITTVDPETGGQTQFGTLPDGSRGFKPFIYDIIPPPVATSPVAVAEPGVFIVSWDGLFVGGAAQPPDFECCNIIGHKIVGGATVLSVPVGMTRRPLDITFVQTDVAANNETWQFSLEAEDYNGNRAAWSGRSAIVTMMPIAGEVDLSGIEADILEVQDAASDAQLAADNAQDAADLAKLNADKALQSSVKTYRRSGIDPVGFVRSSALTPSTLTSVASDGAPGGFALQKTVVSDNNAYDMSGIQDFNPDLLYRVSFKVRVVTNSTVLPKVLYAGVLGLKADGLTGVTTVGAATWSSAHYFAASNVNIVAADGWQTYTGYFKGWSATGNGGQRPDPLVPGTMHTDVRKFAPLVFFDNSGGNGVWELGSIEVDIVSPEGVQAINDAAAAQIVADQAFSDADAAAEAAGTAQDTADSKNRNWYQDTAPAGTGHKDGDQWFDTDDQNRLYLWKGTPTLAWVSFQDGAIAAAQGTANTALGSANGKNRIYYGPTQPSGGTYIAGDTWFDTNDGNKIYVHNGSTFAASTLGSSAIADLAITNAKIDDATIQSAKIGSVDAGTITVGTLNAARIGANSIAVSKLLISDFSNLLENPDFEAGTLAGWTATGGWFVNTAAPVQGTWKALTQYTGASQTLTNNAQVYLRAGEKIRVKTFIFSEAPTSGTQFTISLYNTLGGALEGSLTPTVTSGTWTEFDFVLTATTAGYKQLRIATSATGTGYVRLDVVRMFKMNAGELIVDGSILTQHMTSGTIDAAVLTAGSITTPKLAAKSVIMDKLVITSTDNLAVEADFGNAGSSWQLVAVTKTINATSGRGSLPAMRFTGTVANQTSFNLVNRISVGAEDRFRGSLWVKSSVALTAGQVQLKLRCYTTAVAYSDIVVASNAVAPATENVITPVNTFVNVAGISPVLPTGTIAMEIFLSVTLPSTGAIVDIDYVGLTRASDGKLTLDGAMDAKSITAAYIQTDNTPDELVNGRGIKFNPLGLKAYNALGQKTFDLIASTGDLNVTGTFSSGNAPGTEADTGYTIRAQMGIINFQNWNDVPGIVFEKYNTGTGLTSPSGFIFYYFGGILMRSTVPSTTWTQFKNESYVWVSQDGGQFTSSNSGYVNNGTTESDNLNTRSSLYTRTFPGNSGFNGNDTEMRVASTAMPTASHTDEWLASWQTRANATYQRGIVLGGVSKWNTSTQVYESRSTIGLHHDGQYYLYGRNTSGALKSAIVADGSDAGGAAFGIEMIGEDIEVRGGVNAITDATRGALIIQNGGTWLYGPTRANYFWSDATRVGITGNLQINGEADIKHHRAEFTTTNWYVAAEPWDTGPVVADTNSNRTRNNDFCGVGPFNGSISFTKAGYYSISCLYIAQGVPGSGWMKLNHSANGLQGMDSIWSGAKHEAYICLPPTYFAVGEYVRSSLSVSQAHNGDTRWKVVRSTLNL